MVSNLFCRNVIAVFPIKLVSYGDGVGAMTSDSLLTGQCYAKTQIIQRDFLHSTALLIPPIGPKNLIANSALQFQRRMR